MYISRVEIDSQNRRKIKDLTQVGAFHNWVEQSFPKEFDKNIRSRKLWRIDELRGKQYLLIISSEMPDLKRLEKYGVENSAQTKNYDRFLNSLRESARMKFRVVLNPVISLFNSDEKRGVVKPHVTVEHQMRYLLDRCEKNGFLLNEGEFVIVNRGYEVFRKPNQKSVRLVKVTYEGILTISDVEIFKKVLIEGLGKKKAYGFGMMTVIPTGK